jgi:hypothetical protein
VDSSGHISEGDIELGIDHPYIRNPGFSHDMAGREITVKGRVTGVTSYTTTLGPLTSYELDDYELLHVIEWDYPRYETGDELEKKIHFEWSQWNDQHNVFSPQLDFPAMLTAPAMEIVTHSVSYVMGLLLLANQTHPDGPVKVSVFLPWEDGFPLELINCSLKAGTESFAVEYIDISGGYRDNPEIDFIPSLVDTTGQNDTVHFSDANQNGLFDTGDYFTFNLTKPEADSAILTYCLSINGGMGRNENAIVAGVSYIIMTNKGHLSYLSSLGDDTISLFHMTANVSYEYDNGDDVSTIIEMVNVARETAALSDATCGFYYKDEVILSGPLTDGEVINEQGIRVIFMDINDNGLLDVGDSFSIHGFENRTEYKFFVLSELSGIRFITLRWITGIGIITGIFPLIYNKDPSLIGAPETRTYKIEIEKMYGIPGVTLKGEIPGNWFVVRAEKDGQEIFHPMNLTSNFAEEHGGINITFIDTDNNDFINSGDHFICHADYAGEYQLVLDYVEQDRGDDEYEIIYSQSVSWTV